MDDRNASASFGEQRTPVFPSVIIFLTPPLFAPMTGVPHASDSSTTFPNVSVADGNTIMLEQAYASAKSSPCK